MRPLARCDHSLRRYSLRDSLSGRRRRQGSAVLFEDFDPFINDSAQLSIDFGFVIAMAARANNAGALADETVILIRPFDNLDVSRAFVHDFDSSIFLVTSRSW